MSLTNAVNIDDISALALQELPPDPDFGNDPMTSVAKLFLRDFETTVKFKDKEGNRSTKQVKRYLVDIRQLMVKEIKLINIDYTHFIDYISSYQDKIQALMEKYEFAHPMVDFDKLDPVEKKTVMAFVYLKKLLEHLEGTQVTSFLESMKEACFELLQSEFSFEIFDKAGEPKKDFKELHIAIKNFPREGNIYDITSELLNTAEVIKGNLVSYDDKPRVEILKAWWLCNNCKGAFSNQGSNIPQKCKLCGEKSGFTEIPERFENIDYIYIKVQQHTNSDQSQVGVTDISVKVQGKYLISYFYQNMKPAANLRVTGIVKLSQDRTNKNNPNERILQLQAITIDIEGENTVMQYNEKLLDVIKHRINPQYIENHFNKMARSICPHLYGQDVIKLGVLLQILGAEPMINQESKNRIRGDINLLLVGDSSQGKSDYGHFVRKILPQSIRTIGGKSTTTKAALTTSVDTINGVRVVTFGVLPQCDLRGMAIVDELDKREKDDFEILSYPMDDMQTIPTHKSGLHHEVNARCPVLLIGNPSKKHGRWDPSKTIFEQTNFASWLISRVDIVFVMYDDGNMERKAAMIEHMSKTRGKMVIESDFDKNYKNKIYSDLLVEKLEQELMGNKFEGVYDTETMRHEVHHLKQTYKPILVPNSPADRLLKKNWLKYSSIRTPSNFGDGEIIHDSMMDTRKYNGVERLAKAAARGRRHHVVEEEDMETAWNVMTYSIATLLPQATDDNKVNSGNPLDMIAKSLSPDRMKSTIVAEFMKKRDLVARNLRRKFNSFNRILAINGFRPCGECKGKGEISDGLATSETCLECKGEKSFPRTFTYNDVEDAALKSNVMKTSKECKDTFREYYNNKIITAVGSSSFTLPYRMESLEIQEFTERLANGIADRLMQAEAIKAFGTELPMENIRPTRADQIE